MSYYSENKERIIRNVQKYNKSEKGKAAVKISIANYKKSIKGVLCLMYHSQKSRNVVEYSRVDFVNRFISDKRFIRLYNEWVKGGFKKPMKPSIDRINFKKGYSFDNVCVKTWEENRYKQRMESVLSRGKPVEAILDGTVVATYKSQRIAADTLGCFQSAISRCCRGLQQEVGGYKWRYR